MRVPEKLASGFGKEFEDWIGQFAVSKQVLPDIQSLHSVRFLSRSVIPHVTRLSSLFNRQEQDPSAGLEPYWKSGSNPQHLRLAYFLYFMPSNLFRVASVWSELCRLGFRWPSSQLQAIEFGAGPASGACGIAAGEKFSPMGLPTEGSWALIEQDKNILDLGQQWAQFYALQTGWTHWSFRPFHRKIDFSQGLLPPAAPKFNLFLMSFFLNESSLSPKELAKTLIQCWSKHLEEEGLILLIEPALKLQSRKLLELRKALIAEKNQGYAPWLQVLLPCLGHQNCGALEAPEDWCHEDVMWWRPPYFKIIDQMAGLDRKSLPFSYLVIAKSQKTRDTLLPALMPDAMPDTINESKQRLVSPAHSEGRDLEFFICGEEGKRRARYRPPVSDDNFTLQRGDILVGAELRGSKHATRVEKIKKSI